MRSLEMQRNLYMNKAHLLWTPKEALHSQPEGPYYAANTPILGCKDHLVKPWFSLWFLATEISPCCKSYGLI